MQTSTSNPLFVTGAGHFFSYLKQKFFDILNVCIPIDGGNCL